MRRTTLALAIVLLVLSPGLRAQAGPHCQVVPRTFAAMHGCFRPLLVFSPTARDARMQRQTRWLDADADDMMDRFVLYTPLPAAGLRPTPPLDAPYTVLRAQQRNQIRERFHIPDGQFTVLLLDENGSVMLRSVAPVPPARLNALIDATPRRKAEMQRPGAN